jgi:hypothetical protein
MPQTGRSKQEMFTEENTTGFNEYELFILNEDLKLSCEEEGFDAEHPETPEQRERVKQLSEKILSIY